MRRPLVVLGARSPRVVAACCDGLNRYLNEARLALADQREPWAAFSAFMHRLVDADTHALGARLAGLFQPSGDLHDLASEGQAVNEEIFARVKASGALRPGVVVDDIGLIAELMAGFSIGDANRSIELRHRYLALLLDGLRAPSADPIPGAGPTWAEIQNRWSG